MLNSTQIDDKINFNFTENVSTLSQDVNSTEVKFFNSDSSKQSLGIVSISYVITGAVGVLGNLFAILISFKFKNKNFFQLLLINQSFIDVIAATFLIALSSNTYNSSGNFGLAGKIYCFVWNNKVILWSLFLCSTLNLVVLNLERYLEVVYPIWHKAKLKRLHVYSTMVVVWLVGFAYNLVYKIASSYVHEGRCVHMKKWPSKTVQRFGGVLNALLYFFLPIIVMVYVTISIMRVLKQRTRVANFSSVSGLSQVDKMNRTKRNVSLTLAVVVLCFVLCWSWNQIFFLLFNLGYIKSLNDWFYHFTVYAAFLNCCVNPFIYASQYREFQVKAKTLFCRHRVTGTDDSVTTISTR